MSNLLEGQLGRNLSKNRTAHDIVVEVLTFLIKEGPQRKTRVMGYCGLSFPQLDCYTARLLASGLVVVNDKGKWEIADRGIEFVTTMQHANELLQVKA